MIARLRPHFLRACTAGTFAWRNGLIRHDRGSEENQMARLSQNSSYSVSTDLAAVGRLLSELEPRLERLSSLASRTSSDFTSAAGRAQTTVADALGDLAEKFGKHARVTSDEATKLSKDLLGKVAEEAKYRPIGTLLVAVGVGLLLGMTLSARR
jgi:ElaB/YqjD/DUF883 family membrane-anchored ribosome-binding protein